jgi:hypothetical protein
LGFSFWDQELVHLIAQQTGAQELLVASLDERARNRIEDFICQLLIGVESSIAEYVGHVARLARTFERHGSAVIVGRGVQFILDPDFVFRVRVVCPEEIRMARIAELHSASPKEALRRVKEVERERALFIRRHFNRDIHASWQYDLVVNTGHLTVQTAAEAIVAGYKLKFPSPDRAEVQIPEQVLDSAPLNALPLPPRLG